jgi:hypothetical protein
MTVGYAFGDSITAGSAASDEAHRYTNLFAAYKGWTLVNRGVGSYMTIEAIRWAYYYAVGSTMQSFMLLGGNDAAIVLSDSAKQLVYKRALLAECAWLAIPDVNKKRADRVGDVTFTGTWTPTTAADYWGPAFGYEYPAGIVGKYTTASGAKAVFQVKGRSIYVSSINLKTGTGQFKLTVDGVDKGTYNCYGSYNSTGGRNPYAPMLIRVTNLNPGVTHTVEVEKVGASGSIFFDWGAGCGELAGHPTVYVSSIFRGQYVSLLVVTQFNAIIHDVFTELSDDALDVRFANAFAYFVYPADVVSDLVHPNDSGMAHIAQGFENAIEGTPKGYNNILQLGLGRVSGKAPGLPDGGGQWDKTLTLTPRYAPPRYGRLDAHLKPFTPPTSGNAQLRNFGGPMGIPARLRADANLDIEPGAISGDGIPLEFYTTPGSYHPPKGDEVNFYCHAFDPTEWDHNWTIPQHWIAYLAQGLGGIAGIPRSDRHSCPAIPQWHLAHMRGWDDESLEEGLAGG